MARVLLDGRMSVGGVGRYREELVAALPSTGRRDEIRVVERVSLGLDAPFTPWGLSRVAVVAREWGADLIHGLHLEVPKLSSGAAIVTIHDLIPLDFPASMPNPVARRYFRGLVAASVARARRIIAPSRSTASSLVRHGAPPAKIEIVPIGVGAPFRSFDEIERYDAQNRFTGGRPYVATVAETRPHKNRPGLYAVAGLLPLTTFACRGTPSARAPANVLFISHLSKTDLAMFYAGAELLLMMSFVEGFGLPVLEAAASGTPVVCGRGIGVIDHLDAGVVSADPAEPHEVAERLRKILTEPSARDELSIAAATAASKLTPYAMAKTTQAIYDDVLREGQER